MSKPLSYLGQFIAYFLLMAFVGYFATAPAYTHLASDTAVIKVSFAHAGKIIGECREISETQRKRLPPGARVPMECPRERSNITIEFDLDGETVLSRVLEPTGLSRDGTAYMYESFIVPAGTHRLAMRMRDDVRTKGFDHEKETQVELASGRMLVVDFIPERGGFVLIR
ncbi:MAG: hypothetical protein KJZ96_01650 [Rhodocyclaceae bacterium]|jgi:hypothetical protein|nr:hypothetical protein [Rhodocyclaceae bacterium]MCL4757025.1 hypothetical protein [Rhodocyclaceae bacterium]